MRIRPKLGNQRRVYAPWHFCEVAVMQAVGNVHSLDYVLGWTRSDDTHYLIRDIPTRSAIYGVYPIVFALHVCTVMSSRAY